MKCPVCSSQNYKCRYILPWGKVLQCSLCTCAFSYGCDAEEMDRVKYSKSENDATIELNRIWAKERFSTLQKYVTSGRLLEFGSGTGEFLYTAAQAGFYSVGVDRFQRFRQENSHPMISLIKADASHFRLTTPFDAVAASHILEHFSQPHEFLANVRENLKKTGYFLLEVPNYASLNRIVAGRRWKCFFPYHALYFTPKSLITLLDNAGFQVAHLETVGCSTAQLVGLGVPFIFRRLGLSFSSGWEPKGKFQRFAARLERALLWGFNIRAVARKVKEPDR